VVLVQATRVVLHTAAIHSTISNIITIATTKQ
jgi:hypothetical protein